ncbi:MAG: OmpA family protein [Alphaproteobacteria bacterium]
MAMNAELPDNFAPALPIAGEGTPVLLVAALAVMGTALSVISASIWLTPPMAPSKPVTIVVRQKAPPPRIIKVPVPAPAPPPKIIKVPAKNIPPLCFNRVTLMFATGQSIPQMETEAERRQILAGINRISAWLKKHDDAKLLIEGHADALGTEAINLVLSFARAKSVSKLLLSNGIPANRMVVRAAGAAEAGTNINPRDRRVDISIEGINVCKSASGDTEQP